MKISYNILAIARSLAETLSFNETHSPNLASTTQAGRSCLGIPGLWRLRQVIDGQQNACFAKTWSLASFSKNKIWIYLDMVIYIYIYTYIIYIYIYMLLLYIIYIYYIVLPPSYSFWVGGVGMEVDFSPFKRPINGWCSTGLPQLPHDGLRNLIWDLGSIEPGGFFVSINPILTRWAPTSYKWSYKPYKWPYKWVTGVITLLIGVITPFITSRGPTL